MHHGIENLAFESVRSFFFLLHEPSLMSDLKAIPDGHIVLVGRMMCLKSPFYWFATLGTLDHMLPVLKRDNVELESCPAVPGLIFVRLSPSDAVDVCLDPDTANKKLLLSNYNQTVTLEKEKKPYPQNPERFDCWKQVLSTDGLTGRCYWEVEWEGHVEIAVAYKAIKRSGAGDDGCLGQNDKSWSLSCSSKGFSGLHAGNMTSIHKAPSQRVGVYLDWPAGVLSFYRVLLQKLDHLLSFHNTFTEPVYPAFRIRKESPNSSVTLCQI